MNSVNAKQIPFDLPARPAMGRDDFLIGPENKDAAGWIDKWPKWPAPVLILSGAAASGKTHLAAVWRDLSGADIVKGADLSKISADDIVKRSEHILIDGVDLWIGDRSSETVIFHLYNMFKEQGRSMLLTMRTTPASLEFSIPDLASRLRAAPVAMIHPPEDEFLAALLVKQFYDRQLQVGADVIRYVLPRMERSFAAVRDLVERADALALSEKRPVSVALMRHVLEDIYS